MRKIIVLITLALLLTGCSVKYNLVINDNLSVTEDVKLTGTQEFFNNYYKTTKTNVLQSNLDIYKDILDENNYKYELIKENTPYIHLNRTYDNFNSFINGSKLFNGYFDEIKYLENGNIRKIETIGFNENDPDNPERFNVKELVISIKCPFEVNEHNAFEIDKSTNTYYFELSEENDHKIMLEYDISKKFNPNKDLIKKLIICFIAIILIWVSIIIIDKKNNKI